MYVAEPEVMESITGFEVHRGVLASANRPKMPGLLDLMVRSKRLVVLEGSNDHENIGAIARSARALGFDGMVLNEHHQNIYGLMPSPNIIAAALTQATKKGRIVVLGNLLPLHLNPLRVAEEYAMLDNMSNGRIVAGPIEGEGLVTATIDMGELVAGRIFQDQTGHYNRFDIFRLSVDRTPRAPLGGPGDLSQFQEVPSVEAGDQSRSPAIHRDKSS